MYKIFYIFILCFSLAGCKNTTRNQHPTEIINGKEMHMEHESEEDGLTLNNGKKWKADSVTKINFNLLKKHVENFYNQQDTSIAAYQMIASDLQEDLDKMVMQCKMQGPDHDALHQWLHPLVEQIKQLRKSADAGSASKSMNDTKSQLMMFLNYFE